MAEAAGKTKPIPHDIARTTAARVGSNAGGFSSFQPYFDRIGREEPDLFD